jgi:hypothetical protein
MSTQSGNNEIPGMNAMNDTMEFVRNMWGAMKVPGMTMPSLSPEEINKQITDLKAVESWLQLNMNMLRSSIQALEMQSATLSTLQTMGDNFAQTMKSMTPEAEPEKQEFQSPFTQYAYPKPAAAPEPEPEPEPVKPPQGEQVEDANNMAAQFANPAAWWSVVQDQFSQAVENAMSPVTEAPVAHKTAEAKTTKSKTSSATKKASSKTASSAKKTTATARKKID